MSARVPARLLLPTEGAASFPRCIASTLANFPAFAGQCLRTRSTASGPLSADQAASFGDKLLGQAASHAMVFHLSQGRRQLRAASGIPGPGFAGPGPCRPQKLLF